MLADGVGNRQPAPEGLRQSLIRAASAERDSLIEMPPSGIGVTSPGLAQGKQTAFLNGRFFGNKISILSWSEWSDSNTRPPRPERGALPDCATLRDQRRFYRPASGIRQAAYCIFCDKFFPSVETTLPGACGTGWKASKRYKKAIVAGNFHRAAHLPCPPSPNLLGERNDRREAGHGTKDISPCYLAA